jgi:hypothetical protein
MPKASLTIGHRMSCGEPDAQEWARPVRRAGRGNGPAVTPAPRPAPTQRGDAKVRVLALDHDERDALVRHLDRMGVTELMGCKPASHAGRRAGPSASLNRRARKCRA